MDWAAVDWAAMGGAGAFRADSLGPVSARRGDDPEVSVVVADSDGAAIDRTLASALAQSFRSLEILLVSDNRHDHPRVRRIAPPIGAVSTGDLRNAGLDAARGRRILFVDAGDELHRHACRNLVVAAEDAGAEVAVGRWVRLSTAGRPVDPPVAELYRQTTAFAALDDEPALLRDAALCNKMFDLQMLRRHGVRFDDNTAFSGRGVVGRALALAGGIAVTPQQVAMRDADEAGPVSDLVMEHRALDEFLAGHASPRVQLAKQVSFLTEELPLALAIVAAGSDADTPAALASLGSYLEALPASTFEQLEPLLNLGVFLVRQGDVDGVRSVVDYLAHDRKITTRLVQRDGRVYWSDRHLDTAEGRRMLDVTTVGFQELRLSQLHLESRVDDYHVKGARLVVRGHTINQLGRLPTDSSVEIALVVAPGRSSRREVAPLTLVAHTDDRLDWEGTVDLSSVVRPGWRGYRSWTLRLRLTVAGESSLVPISAYDDPRIADVRLYSRLRWYPLGNALRTEVTPRGNLALRLVPEGALASAVERVFRVLLTASLARRMLETLGVLVRGLRRLSHGTETKARIYRDLLVRLPQDKKSVVFENHMGQSYSDNPRYVFEELARRDAGFKAIWSFAGDPPPMPEGVRTVPRNSWRYFLALARAGYWVDNQGLPPAITKPARTRYLQTWHGSALKRMGEDTPAFRSMPEDRQERHREMVARWDYFVARSEHDVRTLVPALRVRGEVLRSGYPRNDPLVQLRSNEQRAAVRDELGLPRDAVLVLYAPTFRETYSKGRQDFTLQVDLDQMFAKLPEHVLLVRTHYLQRLRLPAAAHAVARDVSHFPDITPLMVAADILVTDYSSVMFDFANTGRPMVFFAYDYDDYVHSERGVYFELAEKAPGPLVHTGEELLQALSTVDAWRPDYEERYQKFVAEFGEYDTGQAARQVVDRVFFGSAHG